MNNKPTLYLIPNDLGGNAINQVFPTYNQTVVDKLSHFLVENQKEARRFVKKICPNKEQSSLKLSDLNKKTLDQDINQLLEPLDKGFDLGIISDAGMPGIADPGSRAVWLAHQKGYLVKSLIGPSSIFLALASSGFSGQQFAFHGYLPIDKQDKKKAIQNLEKDSARLNQTQIVMETPYRNNQFLEALIKSLRPNTRLCVACNLTTPNELVLSKPVHAFKKIKADLHKRPALFLFQA